MNTSNPSFKEVALDWWRNYRDSFFFVLVPMSLGMFFVFWQDHLSRPTAALWAFACLAAGSLIGFLFGVPKAAQNDESESALRIAARSAALQTNTNLERISDWLTKTIVGVGLVELKEIPGFVEKIARFLAGPQSPSPLAESTAAALLILFCSMGFIGGYVNTRLYFVVAFSKVEQMTRNGLGNRLESEGENLVLKAKDKTRNLPPTPPDGANG